MKGRKQGLFPYHLFLLAVNPVLALYQANVGEARITDLIRPALVVLVASALLLIVLRRIVRDRMKTGLIISACMVAFLSYGHAFGFVYEGSSGCLSAIARHRYVLPAWVALFAIGVVIAGAPKRLRSVTLFLNLLSVVLVLTTSATIVHQEISGGEDVAAVARWRNAVATETEHLSLRAEKPARDVYYIILDAYSRPDVLRTCFGCDTSGFLDALRSRGFYVADRSSSNYTYTYASLSSSLNMDYLHELLAKIGGGPSGRMLTDMISDSRVVHYFKSLGYEFVLFPSRYQVTASNPNADIVVTNDPIRISEFERTLLSNSILRAFFSNEEMQKRRILSTLAKLGRVPETNKPTFTFAHIMCPHKSYVFDAKGNWPDAGLVAQGKVAECRLYSGQVRYVNGRILQIVDRILKQSKVPPIIIIQGDHGSRSQPKPPYQRATTCDLDLVGAGAGTEILNAYYLPDGGERLLYPTVSPVNTFRIVFNRYFGGNYRLLPDQAYAVQSSRKPGGAEYVPMPELGWDAQRDRARTSRWEVRPRGAKARGMSVGDADD